MSRKKFPRLIPSIESLEGRTLFHGELLAATTPFSAVSVHKQKTNAYENGAIRAFIITRTTPTDDPLTVHFLVGGRAKNGIDYGRIGTDATIPAGSDTVRIKVRPVDDTLVEGTEAVTMTLVSDNDY